MEGRAMNCIRCHEIAPYQVPPKICPGCEQATTWVCVFSVRPHQRVWELTAFDRRLLAQNSISTT
jgi:hypothetical protein